MKADDLITRVQFDLRTENGKLRALHKVFYERGIKLGAAQVVSEVTGQAGAALKKAAEQVARRQAVKRTLTVAARKIENVNATTQNAIARTLREGLANGEGLPELTKRLQSSAAFGVHRAARVARTNVGSAVSAGRHEGAKHIGADKKSWLTSHDDAVRKTHARCEQETKDGIGIDEPFILGGMAFLMHPGDPNGPAGEVVNCRCMEIVRRAAGKSFDLDYYASAKIINYTDFNTLLTEV
jgi:uncharacterized protein with gpF-like domain